MVTLQEIARQVNLNISVVSRALNPNPDKNAVVKEETRLRIQAVAQALHYSPNRQASFLKKRQAPTILCFIPDFPYDLTADLMFGISEAASHENFPVNFLFGSAQDDFLRFLTTARANSNSGILSYPPQKFSPEIRCEIASYCAGGGKMLLLNVLSNAPHSGEMPEAFRDLPQLNVDDYYGGRLVAEHFLDRGCRDFYYCYPTELENCYESRFRGYADTLLEHGQKVIQTTMNDFFTHLDSSSKAGVFALNDGLALKIEMALLQKGILPGDKILLSGFNDLHYCRQISPSLTSVRQPMREIGRRSVQKLIRMIFGKIEFTETIRPSLSIRESSIGKKKP